MATQISIRRNGTPPGRRAERRFQHGPSGFQADLPLDECASDALRLPELEILRVMALSREADHREGILLRQGRGWFHVSAMGHEALAALAYVLRPDDYIFPYYRDRPLMVARGLSCDQLALEFFARDASSSGGRNMPSHCSSRALNIFSSSTPTGAQCLPAVGAAWGLQHDGADAVVLCTIGDAATRQGEFYEAVCQAVQDKLPVVFVVEDNAYGISTPTEGMLPFRMGIFHPHLIQRVDGRSIHDIADHARTAVERARRGEGPTILWCELDRLSPHTSADDHRVYRSPEELERIDGRDPLHLLAGLLMARQELSAQQWQQMREETAGTVADAYARAERQPPPSVGTVRDHLYGPPSRPAPVPFRPVGETTTMVAAMNQTFRAALESFPNTIMFGQDIIDPKGGVFGFTKSLSTRFPDRVVNAPLAEATIVGTAVGLAAVGLKPVFELQFIDFMTAGFHQLANQIATLRWRSRGDWSCPCVFYAPYGAYLPGGGMWHSQSNDSWWVHMPGIRVAVPSTPQDAAALFWEAIQGADPWLILIPKHLCRMRVSVSEYHAAPPGRAATRRAGTDVTIVTWGNCVRIALQAAQALAKEGTSAEVIDLRTLVPCDWETVTASVGRTGRLVVVHEDHAVCGFGQAIIAEFTASPDRFYLLNAPPQLVARPDVHIPFCPELELALLPDVGQVVSAVHVTLER